MTVPKTEAEQVRAARESAADFLTVDQLCKAVFGRVGERERSKVYVAIHHLGDAVEKRAAAYRKRS